MGNFIPAIILSMNNKTETFLEYKALLFSMAYNMLGSIDAAEDIVQDTFLKWMDVKEDAVTHTKAFLVKIVTNKCINYLNSARKKREEYIGIWLPEPLENYDRDKVHAKVESYHALSIGMLVLMEKLTPQERAIFLLKEVFSYDYNELADIFDKTTDNCRQIFKRAKENLGKDTRRFEVDMKVHEKILNNFILAISEGSVDGLIDLLKEDIMLLADGGGTTLVLNGKRITAFSKPILGRENVSRLLLSLVPLLRGAVPGFREEITFANGMPSILSWSGDAPLSLVSINTDGERISNIYVQTNPDKLKHLKK